LWIFSSLAQLKTKKHLNSSNFKSFLPAQYPSLVRRQCLRFALYLHNNNDNKKIITWAKMSIKKGKGGFRTWWYCQFSCGSSEGWACSASSSSPASSWSWRSCVTATKQISNVSTFVRHMYRTHRTWRGVDGGYHFRGSGAWRL